MNLANTLIGIAFNAALIALAGRFLHGKLTGIKINVNGRTERLEHHMEDLKTELAQAKKAPAE